MEGIQTLDVRTGRTDGRTDGHFPPSNIIRSTFGSRPKKHGKYDKVSDQPPSFLCRLVN